MKRCLALVFLALAVTPLRGAIRSDEQVIFFPSFASQAGEGWRLSIHGWVHEPETRPVLGAFLRRAIPIDRDKLTDVTPGMLPMRFKRCERFCIGEGMACMRQYKIVATVFSFPAYQG